MTPDVVEARDVILSQDPETRRQIAAELLRSLAVEPEGVLYHPERSPIAPKRIDWSIITSAKDPLAKLGRARDLALASPVRTLISQCKQRPGGEGDQRASASGVMQFEPGQTLRFEIKIRDRCTDGECRAVGHVERSPDGSTVARDMLQAFVSGGVKPRDSNREFLECVHFNVLEATCEVSVGGKSIKGEISHWRTRTDEWLSYARASARALLAQARQIDEYGVSQRFVSAKGGAANRTEAGDAARALAELIVSGDRELCSGKRFGLSLFMGERLPAFLKQGALELPGIGRVLRSDVGIEPGEDAKWRKGVVRLELEGREEPLEISARSLEKAGRAAYRSRQAR